MKRTKYGNSKIEVDGEKYDSKRERVRHLELLQRQANGEITDLKRQVKFELIPAIKKENIIQLKTKVKTKIVTIQQPITYTCDFTYYERGEYVVEDVKISKHMLPKEYILKKKMMRYFYAIEIKEYYGKSGT